MTDQVRFLNENTSLPFKVVIPIIVAIVSAAVWIQATLTKIQTTQSEAISRREVTDWRNRFADRNKNIDVPYISEK